MLASAVVLFATVAKEGRCKEKQHIGVKRCYLTAINDVPLAGLSSVDVCQYNKM